MKGYIIHIVVLISLASICDGKWGVMQLLRIPIPRQPYINQLVYIILFLILIFVALTLYDTEGCVEGDGSDTPRQRAECVNACNTTWVRTFFEYSSDKSNFSNVPLTVSHCLMWCDIAMQGNGRCCSGSGIGRDSVLDFSDRCMNGNCRTSRHVKYYIANDEGFEYDNLFFSYIVHTQITNTDSINT